MNRSTSRKVFRKIQLLMKKHGDDCSHCNKEFPHNSKTYGGVTANETRALVKECCAGKLSEVIISGVYVDRRFQDAFPPKYASTAPGDLGQTLSEAVDSIQEYFSKIDVLSDYILNKSGVKGNRANVSLSDNAWKTDDANWFKSNPKRSHRLRPFFKGEAITFPPDFLEYDPPENHEFHILIRQVDVGKRIRIPFCRKLDVPIPDVEELIHALFDIASDGQHEHGAVSVQEVKFLAERYISPNDTQNKPN